MLPVSKKRAARPRLAFGLSFLPHIIRRVRVLSCEHIEIQFGSIVLISLDRSCLQQSRGVHGSPKFTTRKIDPGEPKKRETPIVLKDNEILCVLYASDLCTKGDKCRYSHDESISKKSNE